MLPAVLYGCETWSLTLKGEYLRTKCQGEYIDLWERM